MGTEVEMMVRSTVLRGPGFICRQWEIGRWMDGKKGTKGGRGEGKTESQKLRGDRYLLN